MHAPGVCQMRIFCVEKKIIYSYNCIPMIKFMWSQVLSESIANKWSTEIE